MAWPLIAVIWALPSKLSAPETSLLPLTGLKVTAVSSLVVTASATMSGTAVTVTVMLAVSSAPPLDTV